MMKNTLLRAAPVRRGKGAKATGALLWILGILLVLVGLFGYLAGDLQIPALQSIARDVQTARDIAQNADLPVSGQLFLFGEGNSFLFWNGAVSMGFASFVMNTAVILMLLGLTLIFNAVMLRVQTWENMKDLLCVEPALFFFLLFVYYPVIDLIRISFTDMRMLSDATFEFAGFKNYKWLFTGSGAKYFVESLKITATYTFWELVITLVGGILLALLFSRITKMFNAMRTIVFMPKYIAVSTSAVVFIWILNGRFGILNSALSVFGIQGPDWLNDANTALGGILTLTAWRVVGYAMMIYLSAMKGIPQDYYEAASIDGADSFNRFRYITLPMLAPTSLFLFVTTFIASMKVFQSVDVMTSGGPSKATNVLVYWVFNLSFEDFRVARAASVSVIFFLILLLCTVATMRWSRRSVNYDA
ncbi:MAG TPA: sugar ABC transporter permease [Candidatus Limiplasma sp.]|nr:sugar ABC transporter permease [Candidatus Limiplasma sp.]HRX09865.1 sugar ABC transporter permease [Candidatus Limiplasma sp.]